MFFPSYRSITSMMPILQPETPLPDSQAFLSGARLVLSLGWEAPVAFGL